MCGIAAIYAYRNDAPDVDRESSAASATSWRRGDPMGMVSGSRKTAASSWATAASPSIYFNRASFLLAKLASGRYDCVGLLNTVYVGLEMAQELERMMFHLDEPHRT
jgi:hypothetical protein